MNIKPETMRKLCAFADAVAEWTAMQDTFEKTMKPTPIEVHEATEKIKASKRALFAALEREDWT